MSIEWLAESRDRGMLVARVGRDGDRLVAEWPRFARLAVDKDGNNLAFEANADADPVQVEKLRRGAVRLLLAHLAGSIPLHASAVAFGGRAVVFVGRSGLGKSTLAAMLCEHAGGSLLSDDAVAIERHGQSFQVLAIEERHWLDAASARAIGRPSDALAEKAPLESQRTDVPRAELVLLAHLAFSESTDVPLLVPVSGLDAVGGLLSQLTRFVVDDPDVARRDLAALADLVDRVSVVRLERPRRLDLLRATAELVFRATMEATTP